MILDIPTAADFRESGLSFLNLAWAEAIDLLLGLTESDLVEYDSDGTIADEYWKRSQRSLSTAVTLAQQGAEFLIKERIAVVSPFLLFSGSARDWPKGCERSDCSYAEFRTLDAQDLPRIHDTVAAVRLSAQFTGEFERLRKVRNSLVHTISKNQRFGPAEVLRWVLRTYNEFCSPATWTSARFDYLEEVSPGGVFPSEYTFRQRVARELRATMDVLEPAECKELLNIDKKQRFYFCLECHISDFGFDNQPKTAQLQPNTPESTEVRCQACGTQAKVARSKCGECDGNVVLVDEDESQTCLSCGASA